jgi:beta-galactosidase/beta-glucuronidase
VRAYDDPASTENPRGKQDWQQQPHGIWYRRSTGIWRSVWLETVPAQHVTVLDWSTSFPESLVSAQVRLARVPAPGTEVEVVLSHDGTELARGRVSAGTSRVRLRLDVPRSASATCGRPRSRC